MLLHTGRLDRWDNLGEGLEAVERMIVELGLRLLLLFCQVF